uniref:Uncharacterized protein n=1 Tax=Rhipicephalus microplus TaxID=6941 RepID=A0A6G5AH01_RHIMP
MWSCYCARVFKLAHYLDKQNFDFPCSVCSHCTNSGSFAVILQWDKPGMLVCNSHSTFESVLSANKSGVHTFVWMLSFVVVFVQFCIDRHRKSFARVLQLVALTKWAIVHCRWLL